MIADFTGQQLGNYRLLRKIGSGDFADVYIGEQAQLRTPAAIKLWRVRLGSDDQKNFLKEAQILASLIHPGIVRILDYGVANDIPFLVMDYASKGSLRQRHARGRTLPLVEVVSYVEQIASALQYAHDRNIVHQNVKPENMLIGANNEILLADFGMAFFAQNIHASKTEEMAETRAYIAPEQLEGQAIPVSDQYSLGAVAYEWLRGEPPFHGTSPEFAYKQQTEKPLSILSKNPDVSVAIESVIMIALSKEPTRRFKTLNAFANALRHASFPGMTSTHISGIRPPVDTSHMITAPIKTENNQKELIIPNAAPVAQLASSSSASYPVSRALETIDTSRLVESEQKKPWRLSRRALILTGLGSVAVLAVGGGVAWSFLKPESGVVYQGHIKPVYTLAWSPDSTKIVSGGQDNTAQVWDAATGNKLYTYEGHTGSVNALMWLPADGTSIVSASADQKVHIWESRTGVNKLTYQGHADNIRTLAWSPDGSLIASGGDDKGAQVWKAASGELIHNFPYHMDRVWALAWSKDSRYLATASADKTVKVWDISSGKEVITYRGHVRSIKGVVWSLDGKRIASCGDDHEVQIWDVKTGNLILTYRGHTNVVNAIDWSPDGTRIASGGDDTAVHVWDVTTGEQLFLYKGHTLGLHAIAWSPHGRSIASGSDDRTVQVWSPGS